MTLHGAFILFMTLAVQVMVAGWNHVPVKPDMGICVKFSLTLYKETDTDLPESRIPVRFAQTFKYMENKPRKVLIADDEPDILEILKYNLQNEGYEVITAKDGNEAMEKAKHTEPDMIILDIMMPGKTGVEVCELLRRQSAFKETIIIFLTAINDEETQIKSLKTGADDYVSKPVSPKVFMSKVNSLFRRLNKEETGILNLGDIIIDPLQFVVKVKNKEIILAKKEFELLYLLASIPGRVFLRYDILTKIWGAGVIVGDRTIDVHIRKIRQKLDIECITTVKGVGYKFEL